MSVIGATHNLTLAEAHSGKPDASSSLAQHRAELTQALAERETQSIKPADHAETARPHAPASRRIDKTA